jgi:subtilisin-like proprotein convertase family protein
MESHFSQRVARMARSLWRRPARPAARPAFRPALECLEGRTVPSTLSGIHATGVAGPVRSAVPSGAVFRATDVPRRVDFPDVFTTSFVTVPQSMTIASLKVQLNLTYPLDNDLTIDLIAPDGTDVPLSAFEGTGANFQGTVFDDAAATPIWAGNSPFAGPYQPEGSLSALAGTNAQGTWQLQIIDGGANSGTLNSWSLIIQPVGGANAAAQQDGIFRPVTVASPSLAPTDALPTTLPMAGNPLMAGRTDAIVARPAAWSPKVTGEEPVVVPADTGLVPPSHVHVRTGGRHELNGTGDSGGLVNGIDGEMMP